jgi:hypothetical protein
MLGHGNKGLRRVLPSPPLYGENWRKQVGVEPEGIIEEA